jgi:hypothetical protein
VFIFSRINDMSRFWDVVLPQLSIPNQRHVFHRVGYLNCWNPEFPGW